jgi:hypothetical protein
MTIQPGAAVYTQSFGTRPENVEVPVISTVAPNVNNYKYPIGKRWIDTVTNTEYVFTSLSTIGGVASATWTLLGAAAGALNTLSDGSSTLVTPSAGNIQIAGTPSQIATTAGSSEITLSLIGPYTPASYTAHGVLIGEGASSVVATTPGTTGQALMGNTGADPAFTGSPSFSGSVTAATGLTVTAGGAGITGTTNINTTGAAVTSIGTGGTGAVDIGNATGNTAVTGSLTASTGLTATTGGLTASAGGAAITGTTTINTTGAAATSIGTGGTGAVNIGNNTGNTNITGTAIASLGYVATLGGFATTNGGLTLNTAGNKISIATGANASIGTSAAMTAGTITISSTAVSATSIIFLTCNTPSGTQGFLSAPAASRVANTSFVINSSSALDTSTVNWWIIN